MVRLQEHTQQRGVPPRTQQDRAGHHRAVIRGHLPFGFRCDRFRWTGRRPRHVRDVAVPPQPVRRSHCRFPHFRRTDTQEGKGPRSLHLRGPPRKGVQIQGDQGIHRDPHHRDDADLRGSSSEGRSKLPCGHHGTYRVLRLHPHRAGHHRRRLCRIRRNHCCHVQRCVPGCDHVHRDGRHPRRNIRLLRRSDPCQRGSGQPLGRNPRGNQPG